MHTTYTAGFIFIMRIEWWMNHVLIFSLIFLDIPFNKHEDEVKLIALLFNLLVNEIEVFFKIFMRKTCVT